MRVTLIISGAQTGADLAGLKAGKLLGIGTGGYMPKGWRTELGDRPTYKDLYGMEEWETEDYLGRTEQNVRIADATVIFGRRSPGSNRTEEFCRIQGKPCNWIFWPSDVPVGVQINTFRIWIARNKVSTLNIGGNRESVNKGIEKWVTDFLVRALK